MLLVLIVAAVAVPLGQEKLMPATPVTTDCDAILKALSDKTRRRIVKALLNEPKNVNEVAESLGVAQYTVSQNLRILRVARVVEFKQVGVIRKYHIVKTLRSAAEMNVLEFGCCCFRLDRFND